MQNQCGPDNIKTSTKKNAYKRRYNATYQENNG